jgi:hypothetical protein
MSGFVPNDRFRPRPDGAIACDAAIGSGSAVVGEQAFSDGKVQLDLEVLSLTGFCLFGVIDAAFDVKAVDRMDGEKDLVRMHATCPNVVSRTGFSAIRLWNDGFIFRAGGYAGEEKAVDPWTAPCTVRLAIDFGDDEAIFAVGPGAATPSARRSLRAAGITGAVLPVLWCPKGSSITARLAASAATTCAPACVTPLRAELAAAVAAVERLSLAQRFTHAAPLDAAGKEWRPPADFSLLAGGRPINLKFVNDRAVDTDMKGVCSLVYLIDHRGNPFAPPPRVSYGVQLVMLCTARTRVRAEDGGECRFRSWLRPQS